MTRFRLLRRFLLVSAIAVVAALAASLALRVYAGHRLKVATERFQREAGSLDLASFTRPEVPDEENAATWIGAGMSAVVLFGDETELVGTLAQKRFETWPSGDVSKLDAILDRNGPALELLDRARGRRRSNWKIPYRDGISAKLPNLLAALHATKLLTAKVRLALGHGDRDTAIAGVEALGAMARSLESEPSLIVLLIGTAIEKYQITAIHEIIASPITTADEMVRLADALCVDDLTTAMRSALRANAAGVVNELHWGTIVRETPSVVPRWIALGIADLCAATAIDTTVAAQPRLGQPVAVPLLPEDSAGSSRLGWWQELVASYGPNVADTAARMTATSSARQLARLAIALRHDAIVAGHYPVGVPVVPGVATADPLTGGARIYALLPDGSAEIRSTTTDEILRSIFPTGMISFDGQYRWPLPAPSTTTVRAAPRKVLH
jgi:hypothetical protein